MATLATALVALPTAVSSAQQVEENPRVGGEALYRSGLTVDSSASPLPQPGANSFLVADLDTGDVLAAQNAHHQLPPASTMKMLTALTVLPRVDLDSIYTATDEDVDVEGSKVGIVSGSTYTARQLFEGMFLVSGNDAANAVANLTGSLDGTIDQMQAEAGRIQAYDTVVRNASGLDAGGQVSSAYDLALIARAGMDRADFRRFAALSDSTFPMSGTEDPETRPTFEIWNQNTLVTGGYEGAIGVKSGFTTNAGRTFAAAAEKDGRRYLVTLMGIQGNTYETGGYYLDWAFANGTKVKPVGKLVEPKLKPPQSDAAAVVEAADTPVSAGGGASFSMPSISMPSLDLPSPYAGRTPFYIAVTTLAVALFLAWRLRAPYRKAVRRRQPPEFAQTREQEEPYIDLRSPTRMDSRV